MNTIVAPTIKAANILLQEASLRSSARLGMYALGKTTSSNIIIPPIEKILTVGSLQALRGTMQRISVHVASNRVIFTSTGIIIGTGVAVGAVIWSSLDEKTKEMIKEKIYNCINYVIENIDKTISNFIDKIIKPCVKSIIDGLKSLFKCFDDIRKSVSGGLIGVPSASDADPATDEPTTTTDNDILLDNLSLSTELVTLEDAMAPIKDATEPSLGPSFEIPVSIEFHPGTKDFIIPTVEQYVRFAIYGYQIEVDCSIAHNISSSSIDLVKAKFRIHTNPTCEVLKDKLMHYIDEQIYDYFSFL